jgi:hypothetical protein
MTAEEEEFERAFASMMSESLESGRSAVVNARAAADNMVVPVGLRPAGGQRSGGGEEEEGGGAGGGAGGGGSYRVGRARRDRARDRGSGGARWTLKGSIDSTR